MIKEEESGRGRKMKRRNGREEETARKREGRDRRQKAEEDQLRVTAHSEHVGSTPPSSYLTSTMTFSNKSVYR
jgi:hypothetical protein